MKCDNCKYYEWYYDKCLKWDCEVDARSVQNCFEPMEVHYDREIKNKTTQAAKSK